MSSDWKDTNAVWQDDNGQSEDEDLYEIPPLQGQQEQLVIHPEADSSLPLQDEDNVEETSELSLTRLEVIGGFLRQISPLLAPLLFGGVTFVFILTFVLNSHAYLTTSGFLPVSLILLTVGLILLAFAVGQGIMLYYAGTNDALWSLGMICGFSLFLLVGCFAIFGPLPSLILFIVLAVGGILLLRLCIRPTPEGRVDIVQAFGKHTRTLFPGLNFIAPWEQIQYALDTRETVWSCPTQRVSVSRSEEVHLAASISYRLMPEDAHLAALYVNDWQKSLHELFVSTTQAVVGELSPADFIIWPQTGRSRQGIPADASDAGNWDRINNILAQRMQDAVAHWGVQINWARIRDATVVPHVPPSIDTRPLITPEQANRGATQGAAPATTQLYQAQTHPKQSEQATTENSPSTPVKSPEPAPAPAASPKVNRGDMLKEAYAAVRTGRITDPETIRDIAARFEAIANHPEESQNVDFDPARAAQILHERAKLYEEQALAAAAEYDNDVQPDWSIRRPSDNNMMAGG